MSTSFFSCGNGEYFTIDALSNDDVACFLWLKAVAEIPRPNNTRL